jgi:hypothetical protein
MKASEIRGEGTQSINLLHKFLILYLYAGFCRVMFEQIQDKTIDG